MNIVDRYFQKRWETLLSVDELMMNLLSVLSESERLDSTYIIYASDNGYHLGQHAQPFDKRQPYETDIKVPLLMRGPDVPQNRLLDLPVSLLDLAPTILEWVGVPVPNYMDGRSLRDDLLRAQHSLSFSSSSSSRTLLIEYWGEGNEDTFNPACPGRRSDHLAQCTLDADCHCQDAWNNTYSCVRDFRYQLDRIYCEFIDNENFVEAYDLALNPYQLKNNVDDLLPIERGLYGILLRNLTACVGAACRA